MARKERVQKTNAMRELERGGVAYEAITFEEPDPTGVSDLGVRIANMLGYAPEQGFKTLVCVAPAGGHVVCCVPSGDELDLKKAAAAAGEKSLSLMPIKDLEAVTGYVRGGCTPIGMKKPFPTLIDETAQLYDEVGVSGGRRGLSIRLSPDDLVAFLGATLADITQ